MIAGHVEKLLLYARGMIDLRKHCYADMAEDIGFSCGNYKMSDLLKEYGL